VNFKGQVRYKTNWICKHYHWSSGCDLCWQACGQTHRALPAGCSGRELQLGHL